MDKIELIILLQDLRRRHVELCQHVDNSDTKCDKLASKAVAGFILDAYCCDTHLEQITRVLTHDQRQPRVRVFVQDKLVARIDAALKSLL